MASGGRVGNPVFDDARFINKPVLILDGGTDNFPIQNKWIRVQLVMEQSSMVARKASRDKRPMGPPTFILMNLYQVHYNVAYDHNGQPIEPPPNCPETLIPATDDLSTYFVCVPSLFRVHPPTREEELGRVLRTTGVGGEERVRARKGELSGTAHSSAGRDCDEDGNSDESAEEDGDPEDPLQDSGSSSVQCAPTPYPYPATAISCNDPRWPEIVAAAREQARQHWPPDPNRPCPIPINQRQLQVGEDVSREEMAWIQEYLPREDLRFVETKYGFEDLRSRLQEVNNRKGCFVLNSLSTGGKGFVFVFDNILLLDEGYWAIRFAVCNIGWTAHSVYRSGEGSYGFLADIYTGVIGVYSSKQWPKLPPTSKVTEHYAAQIKLCHRMQPGIKGKSRKSPSPTSPVINTTVRGKGKAATTKRSRGRQMASLRTLIDGNQYPPRPRRRPVEIRRDAGETNGASGVPPLQWMDRLEHTGVAHDAEIEVVRTETCSPALSALVMATAGHGRSEGWCANQQPTQNHQIGLHSPPHRDPLSIHQAPRLLDPAPPSTSMSRTSQDQPVTTNTRVRILSSYPTRSPSCPPRLLRPRRQSPQPFSLPSPPTIYPAGSPSSMYSIPPRPPFLARSLSWMHYPSAPFTEQAALTYAPSTDPTIQALQAHNQERYTMDYSYPNQYHQQPLTAYTEDYHHMTFDPGQGHIPSVNSYSSPTSTASFTSATLPMDAAKYPYSPPGGDGASQ